jgi:predicted Na+-dependent transporter
MRAFLKQNLLVLVIGVAAVLALLAPQAGLALKDLGLIPPMIVVIFLCQGAGIDARRFRHAGSYLALLAWGCVIAFALAPAAGWAVMALLGWEGDDRLGFLLICCMGPTLVSGIVIATQAGGEREGAALLTIVLNLLAVLTIPFTLALTVGGEGAIDRWGLLTKLLLLVLLPAIVGQLLRLRWPLLVATRSGLISLLPIILLGCTIYLALSERSGELRGLGLPRLLQLVLPALAVHYLLMGVGYAGARWGLRSERRRATALAVVSSQKTIPVAIAIWSTEFAAEYPLALIPPIIFHLTQIYGDGLLAGWGGRRIIRQDDLVS